MAQWGLMTGTAEEQAQQYGAIIDKINKVADNFPTTSADIMDALKKVSSAFNLAGADIDETIATIVAAEKASQRGGKVIGTALSNIVQQIKAEGKLDLAEQLGLNFFKDANKTEFKPIMEIFQEISDRMASLKKQGKESSVEMQNLLELFTVFRRNIGASLLGEMEGGEESTYMKVYKTSLDSVGYSLQENAKYMATAKAAQEQFNTSVLQLKTAVWDSGVEDTYKSMLIFGKQLVGNVGELIKQFGGLPVVMGTVTLAFSLLSKQMKVVAYDSKTGMVNLSGFAKELTNVVKKVMLDITAMPKAIKSTMDATTMSFTTLKTNLDTYGVSLKTLDLETIALKASTVALNLSLTAAATAGVMLLTSAIQFLINKEAEAIRLQEEATQSTKKQIDERESEISTLESLIKEYDKLSEKTERTPEDTIKIQELQAEIKDILGEQSDTIDLINGKYDEQKQKLKELSLERKKELLDEKEKLMIQKQIVKAKIDLPSLLQSQLGTNYNEVLFEHGGVDLGSEWDFFGGGGLKGLLDNSSIEEALDLFTQWEKNLRGVAGQSKELGETYEWVSKNLDNLKSITNEANEAEEDFRKTSAEIKFEEMFPEGLIKNAEAYQAILERLEETAENSEGSWKVFNDTLVTLFKERFSEFAPAIEETNTSLESSTESVEELSKKMEQLQSEYNILTTAQKELSDSGEITMSTFKNLIDNNLLNYLDVVNGKVIVNTGSLKDFAEETKIAAIETLKAAASEDIHKLALGKEAEMSETAKNAIANFGNQTAITGNQARTAAGSILELASALAQAAAANAQLAGENNVQDFNAKASAISSAYQSAAKKIGAISISSASSSGGGSRRSGSGGSKSGSRGGSSKTSDAEKKEEEAYKKRLEKFKETLEKMTSKEEEWVKKQKELGLLSNSDMLYVTKQRITKYNEYLEKIKKATWMNKEDRLKLEEEYTKKIKDLELDYFDYLKGKLNDQVKAIEESRDARIKILEQETDKKKKLIKEEADERIKASKTEDKEKERNKAKEDYEKERKKALEKIEYWQQRTGREAVENLANAKKSLEELDKDWTEKVEDWNTDDLIKSIEEERDAEIKALEETTAQVKQNIENEAQARIDAVNREYEAKVQAFSESNQIIYDNSVISAKNLYNIYKSEFVDPLKNDLKNINQDTTSSKKKYTDYTVKSGDTLASIAKKYGTTVKKIKEANSSLKNTKDTTKLKKGQKLKIPKFHGGGIFDGVDEGLALLKKGEWILRPEWGVSMNRLMKYFDNLTQGKTQPIGGGDSIEVNGNLVNIEANVRNQSDIDAIGQKVEKILKEKFNIRK